MRINLVELRVQFKRRGHVAVFFPSRAPMNTKKLKVLWPKAKKDLPTYLYKGQALCLYLLASRRASGENVSLEGEGLKKKRILPPNDDFQPVCRPSQASPVLWLSSFLRVVLSLPPVVRTLPSP